MIPEENSNNSNNSDYELAVEVYQTNKKKQLTGIFLHLTYSYRINYILKLCRKHEMHMRYRDSGLRSQYVHYTQNDMHFSLYQRKSLEITIYSNNN
jgi:hypothetical protein